MVEGLVTFPFGVSPVWPALRFVRFFLGWPVLPHLPQVGTPDFLDFSAGLFPHFLCRNLLVAGLKFIYFLCF